MNFHLQCVKSPEDIYLLPSKREGGSNWKPRTSLRLIRERGFQTKATLSFGKAIVSLPHFLSKKLSWSRSDSGNCSLVTVRRRGLLTVSPQELQFRVVPVQETGMMQDLMTGLRWPLPPLSAVAGMLFVLLSSGCGVMLSHGNTPCCCAQCLTSIDIPCLSQLLHRSLQDSHFFSSFPFLLWMLFRIFF